MKNLFEAATVQEVKARIAGLRADSARQWGDMDPAQAMAHCIGGLQTAVGDSRPPRVLIGYVIGGLIKPKVVGNDEPLRKNSPTAKSLVVADERDLAKEKDRLVGYIDRFVAGGPAVCTDHPHAFFGKMKPNEWAVLMYKHLDHHLRQFGA